jgi:uncharacterized protein (TIGR02246 family)
MILNLFLCAAALSLGAAQRAPASSPSADDVLKREQQRVDLLAAGKLDEVAAMLSPTLTYTHSSGAVDGKDAVLASLRSGQVVYKALKHSDVQVRLATPDVAILNGISDITVVVGGKAQEVPVRFTIVYVRKNGVWLMEVWHATRRPAS